MTQPIPPPGYEYFYRIETDQLELTPQLAMPRAYLFVLAPASETGFAMLQYLQRLEMHVCTSVDAINLAKSLEPTCALIYTCLFVPSTARDMEILEAVRHKTEYIRDRVVETPLHLRRNHHDPHANRQPDWSSTSDEPAPDAA